MRGGFYEVLFTGSRKFVPSAGPSQGSTVLHKDKTLTSDQQKNKETSLETFVKRAEWKNNIRKDEMWLRQSLRFWKGGWTNKTFEDITGIFTIFCQNHSWLVAALVTNSSNILQDPLIFLLFPDQTRLFITTEEVKSSPHINPTHIKQHEQQPHTGGSQTV